MPKPSDKETHRSFTIRLPLSLYLEIFQLAQDENSNLNQKVTQLVLLGMDKHISLNDALRALLLKTMTDEDARD